MIEIKEELLDIEGIKNSKKPLIDLFIRRTAVITQTDEALTEKIIKDQWKNANKMVQSTSSVAGIDFCNIGELRMSPVKARKRIERLNNSIALYSGLIPEVDEKTQEKYKGYVEGYQNTLRIVKFKTKQSDETEY